MFKNILSILGGTIGAQLVALFAAPVITRIFPPDEFGRMTVVWAIIGMAGVIACLAYERTVVIERNDEDARSLVTLCIYLSLLSAVAVATVVYLFGVSIGTESFNVKHIYLFVFAGVFLFGVRNALDLFATREKRFHLIAGSILFGAISSAIWKISMGVAVSASAEVLLIGNVVTLLVPATILLFYLRRNLRTKNSMRSPERKWNLLRRYSEFPRNQVPNATLNTLQQQAPVFILAAYFSPEMVGFYGLASTVLLRPVRAMAEAVSRVYLQRASNFGTDGPADDFLKVTAWLGVFAAPFCLILFFFGEYLFRWLFGEQWGDAGHMAALMTPWVFMLVVNVPTTQTLFVRRELRYLLVFNALYLIVRVSGLLIAIYITRNVYISILVFSLIGFVANIFYIRKGFLMARHA